MKRLLISHVDLDGTGAPIIVNLYFKNQFDQIILRDYGFEEDEETVNLMKTFDEIIIADLSAPEEFIESFINSGIIVKIYDHHLGASWLDQKDYGIYDENRCGTKIFWEEWAKPQLSRYYPLTDHFVELVDVYDRWQQTNSLWDEAKALNSVLYNKNINWNEKDSYVKYTPFIDRIINKIKTKSKWEWSYTEEEYICESIKKENDALNKALSTMKVRFDYKGKKFGIIAIGSKISLVCSEILNQRDDLDYIVCLNLFRGLNGKLSFRTKKDNVDLNELCCCAGHASAAGGQVIPELAEKFWNDDKLCWAYKDMEQVDPVRQSTWLVDTSQYLTFKV